MRATKEMMQPWPIYLHAISLVALMCLLVLASLRQCYCHCTVVLLHPSSRSSRCLNRAGERAPRNNQDWDLAKASAKKVLGLLRKGKWHPAKRYTRPAQPKRLDALPVSLCCPVL